MKHINIEIKARCRDFTPILERLHERAARFVGEDHQVDTYFKVPHGRLKLRSGPIEQALIHYVRPDSASVRQSDVTRCEAADPAELRSVLTQALGILVVVEKRRRIYFVDNVKVHLDVVHSLGAFVEIEAVGTDETSDPETLRRQCREYLHLFGIDPGDLVASSYSDLLLGLTP